MPLKVGDWVTITLVSPDGKSLLDDVRAQVVLMNKEGIYVDYLEPQTLEPQTREWKLARLEQPDE
jgi:hypothetical protein